MELYFFINYNYKDKISWL